MPRFVHTPDNSSDRLNVTCQRSGGCRYGSRVGVVTVDTVPHCAMDAFALHGVAAWSSTFDPAASVVAGVLSSGPFDATGWAGPFDVNAARTEFNRVNRNRTYDVAGVMTVGAVTLWTSTTVTGSDLRSAANQSRLLNELDESVLRWARANRDSVSIYYREVV